MKRLDIYEKTYKKHWCIDCTRQYRQKEHCLDRVDAKQRGRLDSVSNDCRFSPSSIAGNKLLAADVPAIRRTRGQPSLQGPVQGSMIGIGARTAAFFALKIQLDPVVVLPDVPLLDPSDYAHTARRAGHRALSRELFIFLRQGIALKQTYARIWKHYQSSCVTAGL